MKGLKLGNLELANPLTMSPLCGVTDLPFRRLVQKHGASLTHTQMVSCAALVRSASDKTRRLMELADDEGPVGIQLFGCDPAEMAEAARLAEKEGADLISINFGCPVPKVIKHNGGSAMMKEPDRLEAVVRAVVAATKLPVVPKIRAGWDEGSRNAVEVGLRIEQAGAAGVAIHGRTRSQGYGGEADWSLIADLKKALKIPVIGNGDLFSPEKILWALEHSGVDGVMLGRGAMGNPWIFSRTLKAASAPSALERVSTLLEHMRANFEYKGPHGLAEMRKLAMWYLKGLPFAAETRAALNQTLDMAECEGLLSDYLTKLETPVLEAV